MSDDRPDYAKRLEEARVRRGFKSAKAASDFFGWTYDSYAQHENGTRGITRAAAKYAKAYRVSEAWLLTGEGDLGENRFIPHISWVSAGTMMRDDVSDEAIGMIEVARLPPGDWMALTVRGDSMDRISPPESIILVDRRDKRLVANACYIIDDGEGNATYKRFRPDPMRFEPVSTNPANETLFPDNEPTVIGRVKRSMIDM